MWILEIGLVALIVTSIISGANYWIINLKSGLRWGVRAALLPLIGGMFTYIYLAINMPGSESMLQQMGTWGVMLFVDYWGSDRSWNCLDLADDGSPKHQTSIRLTSQSNN